MQGKADGQGQSLGISSLLVKRPQWKCTLLPTPPWPRVCYIAVTRNTELGPCVGPVAGFPLDCPVVLLVTSHICHMAGQGYSVF